MAKDLRELAKNLRKRSTDTENYLWLFLRNRQVEGVKFRRQEPMGCYIADFVSYEKKLVIELDGGQHDLNNEKDKKRDMWFKDQGYEVLRFWDNEVFKNKDGVLETIRKKLLTPHLNRHPPLQISQWGSPLPPIARGEEYGRKDLTSPSRGEEMRQRKS